MFNRRMIPQSDTTNPDDLKIMLDGVDYADSFFNDLDGCEIVEAGNPAKVAFFTVDHDHHRGGWCLAYNKQWQKVFWSQSTGYEWDTAISVM